jgi:ATP-dependent Clp protease ATP-binding subunit ClpB/ATP-dependent Clp protease ATP-binding subunit ClpC
VVYGARNLRRTIQRELEDPISEKIIESFDAPISRIHISATDNQVTVIAE